MINKYKEELLDIIHSHVPDCTVYLFGSRSRKQEREGSDLDLALDSGFKLSLDTILDIKSDIEDTTFPLFVDIVDMQRIPKELKEEILKDGIKWTS